MPSPRSGSTARATVTSASTRSCLTWRSKCSLARAATLALGVTVQVGCRREGDTLDLATIFRRSVALFRLRFRDLARHAIAAEAQLFGDVVRVQSPAAADRRRFAREGGRARVRDVPLVLNVIDRQVEERSHRAHLGDMGVSSHAVPKWWSNSSHASPRSIADTDP